MIYDAIIIGLGGMGSSALYHLAKRGCHVLGIERFEIVHPYGSSHGHTRVIRKAYFEHPSYVPLLEKAYRMWNQIEDDSGKKVSNLCGMLYAGAPGSGAIQGVKSSSQLYGITIEELSHDDVQHRYPMFHLDDNMVGIVEPSGGYLLVEQCIQVHCEQARWYGAELKTSETTLEWKQENGVFRVFTDRGEYHSKTLVVCAGAWTGFILQSLQFPFAIQRIPSGWFEPNHSGYTLDEGFPVFGFQTEDGFYYGIPQLDNRGVKIAQYEGRETIESVKSADYTVKEHDLDHVKWFITKHLPGMSTQVNHSSICLYTMTPDHHFIIDRHPQHENLFIAAGFSGHGFKFASAIGATLADLVVDGQTDVDLELFQYSRFDR